MSDLRTAAQQALEALERYRQMMFAEAGCRWDGGDAAITALRAALAQQAEGGGNLPPPLQAEPVEPVAWRYKPMIGSSWSLSDDGYYVSCKRDKGYIVDSLYTAPPQRKPLTEEEIDALIHPVVMADLSDEMTDYEIARAVERAHGIKEN